MLLVASEILEHLSLRHLVLVASLCVEGVEVGLLSAALLGQGGILGLGGLQARIGSDYLDVCLLLGLRDEVLGEGLGFVDELDDLGLNLALGGVALTLDLGNKDVLDLFGLDNGDFLVSSGAHAELVLLNLGTVDLRLQVLHLAIVVSLHVCQLLVLLVL